MGNRTALALTLVLLLTVGALAGCTSNAPSNAPDNSGNGGGGGGGGGGSSMTATEAQSTYRTALDSLSSGGSAPNPLSMTVGIRVMNGTNVSNGVMDLYIDTNRSILVMEMNGSAFAPNASSSIIQMPAELITAQVGKTMLLGSPQDLIGFYNASQTPVRSLGSADNSTGGVGSTTGFGAVDPTVLLNATANLPPGDHVTYKLTTYQGHAAVDLTVDHANATDGPVHLDALVLLKPARLVSLDAEILDANATSSSTFGGHYAMHMTFAYGQDASVPHLSGILRMASMTFTNATSIQAAAFGSTGNRTWTVQPSMNPGLVALSDVTLEVRNATSDPRSTSPVLSMPLSQGTAQNSLVKVSYVDADHDGHVSPGDTIALSPKGQGGSFSVSLHDSVSGMSLMPGFGTASLLAALGAAVLVLRRRA